MHASGAFIVEADVSVEENSYQTPQLQCIHMHLDNSIKRKA